MSGQIPEAVKEQRNQVLLDLLRESSLRGNRALMGTSQEVLVEGPARRGENLYQGRTRGNRKVIFTGAERLVGELLEVKINRASVTTLFGALSRESIDQAREPLMAAAG